MPEPAPGAVPFDEAIAFLEQKVRLPTRAWTDLKEGAHARGFVVAGAMRDELLADFHAALQQALREGRTKADFQKDFDAIVARHGWAYKGGRTWRARVIYDTNMRMARAAGRWDQIERRAAREKARGRVLYLRYVAVMDDRTRPEHQAWHGLVLPADHPFWRTHYPPNGWYCRCTVQSLTERELARHGFTPTPDDQVPEVRMERREVNTPDGAEIWPTPAGIDTGFGYNVGQSWLRGAVPRELQNPLPTAGAIHPPLPLPPLPAGPAVPAERLLPAGLAPEEYVARFLEEFGAGPDRPVAFRDASGAVVGIGRELFETRDGRLKVTKYGRERYLLLLADAIRDPDEIWVDWVRAGGGFVLRRRYLKAFDMRGVGGGLTSFEWTQQGWHGVTAFPAEREAYLQRQRTGALIWRKK